LIEIRLAVPDGNAYVKLLKRIVEVLEGTALPLVDIEEAVATRQVLTTYSCPPVRTQGSAERIGGCSMEQA
jgi:hypothetical protein